MPKKNTPKKPTARSPYVGAQHTTTINFRPRNDQVTALHEICRAKKVTPSELLRGALDRIIQENTAKTAW